MSISGEIGSLYSDREQTKAFFPTTKVKAISDDNGVGLDALMENMVYTGSGIPDTVPINADTLGGKLPEDYAPAGYGLGDGNGYVVTDFNAIDFNGFFVCEGNVANSPEYSTGSSSGSYDYGWGYSTSRYGSNVEVNYFPATTSRIHLVRRKISDVWYPWEYENPPMQLGVEYCTTERWDGKAVWTVLVNCGAYADDRYVINTNYTCEYVIDARGRAGFGMLPRLRDTYDNSLKLEVVNSSGYMTILVRGANVGDNECIVQVWYTKY